MTLTEQWKNGELEAGWYYVLLFSNEEYIAFIDGNWVVDDRLIGADIKEVLAPVPSYDRFCRLNNLENDFIKAHERINELKKENAQLRKWCEEFNALDVAEENQQLKELLRKCRSDLISCFAVGYEDSEFIKKITNAIGEKK